MTVFSGKLHYRLKKGIHFTKFRNNKWLERQYKILWKQVNLCKKTAHIKYHSNAFASIH